MLPVAGAVFRFIARLDPDDGYWPIRSQLSVVRVDSGEIELLFDHDCPDPPCYPSIWLARDLAGHVLRIDAISREHAASVTLPILPEPSANSLGTASA